MTKKESSKPGLLDELVSIARSRIVSMNLKRPGGLSHSKAIAADLARAIDALAANQPDPTGISWRCFHCSEIFRDAREAADHFGDIEDMPACYAIVEEGAKAIVEDRRYWRNRAQAAEDELEERRARLPLRYAAAGVPLKITREQAERLTRSAT